MPGGGVYLKGKLVGIHLGGILDPPPTYNVFYPIKSPLFERMPELFKLN